MRGKRKQITFDLDTNVCKKIFGEDKFRRPYREIRNFFLKNDFTPIEGSSYMSNQEMSNLAISDLLDSLIEKYPYLKKCVKKIHQADISNIHSLENHFEYDGTPGEFAKDKKEEKLSDNKKKEKRSKSRGKSR